MPAKVPRRIRSTVRGPFRGRFRVQQAEDSENVLMAMAGRQAPRARLG